MTIRGALVLLLFIGECMPWLSVGDFRVSCFAMPWQVELMNMPSLYGLYLLPMVVVPTLLRGMAGYPNRIPELMSGTATWLTFMVVVGWHEGTHPLIGLAAYASIALATVLIADALGLLGKLSEPKHAVEPEA